MKNFLVLSLLAVGADGFTPSARSALGVQRPSTTARSFGIDPSHFQDVQQHLSSIGDIFSSINLADAAPEVVDAAAEVAKADNGWFGFLTGPIGLLLVGIHSLLESAGIGGAWGISIIALTVLIKVVTYPLTKTQLESTNKMQQMQPAIKEIQAKYQSNPEVMNQKIAEFYQVNEINPLAGCIPSLVQIPVFIGLYRAVLDLAAEGKLNEPFLWLPSLEGPTYGADPTSGSDWILKGWIDGTPSLGWDDTLAFIILPIFLVVSQYVSMELMQPKSDDPAQQQSNAILKVLPVMIGWFSLNVPSALCVYWVVNNIVTTATSLYIRNSMQTESFVTPGSGGSATMPPPPETIFAPPPKKPAGFGEAPATVPRDGVKPITSIDAEIVEDDGGDGEMTGTESEAARKKRGGKKKKKKKN